MGGYRGIGWLCVAMQLLGCCGWFPERWLMVCCYAVARMLWLVAAVLLYGCQGVAMQFLWCIGWLLCCYVVARVLLYTGFPLFHEDQIQGLSRTFLSTIYFISSTYRIHTPAYVMKVLTVLNIFLTLNIYLKNFRVIMFWMCRFNKFRPFWAVMFKGI